MLYLHIIFKRCSKLGSLTTYSSKKEFFSDILTLYGRNVVLELLQDKNIDIYRLHLSSSNKTDGVIKEILSLADQRSIETLYHTKMELSRISKNSSQDQGVAIDIKSQTYLSAKKILDLTSFRLVALDGIQNPQNLGMIVRSCAAGNIDGIVLPRKNSAKISPLVIKASAGTLFKIPIYHCETLAEILPLIDDALIYSLSSHAKESIFDIKSSKKMVFILGNESDGVSSDISKLTNSEISIPMKRGVESLNVAATATILAFLMPR